MAPLLSSFCMGSSKVIEGPAVSFSCCFDVHVGGIFVRTMTTPGLFHCIAFHAGEPLSEDRRVQEIP